MEADSKGGGEVSGDIPAKVDMVLVLGGFNSSNTAHLLEIAEEEGITGCAKDLPWQDLVAQGVLGRPWSSAGLGPSGPLGPLSPLGPSSGARRARWGPLGPLSPSGPLGPLGPVGPVQRQ
eukprot:s493_g18.t1